MTFSPCFIVPVYNHGATVGATLAALARHGLPIYLVDDGSEAATATVLDRLATRIDQVRLVPAIASALELRIPLRKLSQRQRQVLRLMAAGRSTREIARELELSIKTVETHRAEVMKRLGVRDLASLVRYAIRTGIGT